MPSEMVERVARAMMNVRARQPGAYRTDEPEQLVLTSDPDFDDLPLDGNQGTEDDEITQEAVLKLARAAIEAMREPTAAMSEQSAWIRPRYDDPMPSNAEVWRAMIDEALRDA